MGNLFKYEVYISRDTAIGKIFLGAPTAYITRSCLYYKEALVKQAAACTLQGEPLAADKLPKWWRVGIRAVLTLLTYNFK